MYKTCLACFRNTPCINNVVVRPRRLFVSRALYVPRRISSKPTTTMIITLTTITINRYNMTYIFFFFLCPQVDVASFFGVVSTFRLSYGDRTTRTNRPVWFRTPKRALVPARLYSFSSPSTLTHAATLRLHVCPLVPSVRPRPRYRRVLRLTVTRSCYG